MAAEATSLSELRAQYEDFLRGEVRNDYDAIQYIARQ
jgi:hypothetical protein